MKAAVLNRGSPAKRILWLTFFVLILFASSPAFAASYYVSTNGSDSNPGTQAAPFKTIARGSRALAAGDTLLIRAGTYAEAMYHGLGGFTFRSGTAGDYTRYAAYPGDEGKVIVKPPGGNIVVFMGGHSYVEIKGLVLDAVNTSGGAVIITREKDLNNRIINNEIRNGRQGIGGGGNHEIIGNNIHHMRGYGIYTGENNGLVEGNIFHDNGGYAIHLFQQSHTANNWVIRNNVFFNNGRGYYFEDAGVPQLRKVQAVLISRGTNNQFYNNLVYNNNSGVFVGMGAIDTLVANNTIYGNDGAGIDVSSDHNGSRNARIINNIVWGNKNTQIRNTGTNTTLANNLTSDPKVVNAASGDFHLTSVSTDAIDKGQTLSNVPNDFDYGKRPFGSSYDIGAFEFGAPPSQSPSTPIAPGGGTTPTSPGTNPCPPAAAPPTASEPTTPLPPSQSTGASYYVSPTGNDGAAGTEAAPWKTFQKAVNTVKGGETVYFRAGTYAAPNIRNLNPPAGQWITFRPYTGEKVTINTSIAASPQGSLMIFDSSYLIFEGLDITDVNYRRNLTPCDVRKGKCPTPDGRAGIDIRASDEFSTKTHHLIFRNNDIHHNARHGMLGGAADVQLLNNKIHDNGYPAVGGQGYGTYIDGQRWIVRGNDIHHNTGNNLRLANTSERKYYAVDWIVEQNLIHDALGPFWHSSGRPQEGFNAALYGMDGGIFRNNILYNGYGAGVWSRNMAGTTLIYNNTIYNHGDAGLILSGKSIATNNIIYKSAQRNSNFGLIIDHTSTAQKNIVGGNSSLIVKKASGTESNNFRNADPRFVNPTGGDFHLQAGSSAIDQGATLKEVPGDYAGGARPFGAVYDIGAFEQGSTPGTIGPAPPPASGGGSGSTGCNAIKIVTEDESCVKAGETVPLSIKLVDAVTNQQLTPPGDVYISLIPPGFRLSAGTVFQSTPLGSVYKLTPAQLSNLSITPPPGYDGTLTMSISYTPPIPGANAAPPQ